jgi:hypothetical protein
VMVSQRQGSDSRPQPVPQENPDSGTSVSLPPPRQTFTRLPRVPIEEPPLEPLAPEENATPAAEAVPPQTPGEPSDHAEPVERVERVVVRHVDVPVAARPAAAPLPAGGRISGKVTFLAEPPPETPIALDPTCGRNWERLNIPARTRHYLLGKDRGLADVVVSLRLPEQRVPRWAAPRAAEVLVTQNCRFEPYILALQAGQPLMVENRDAMLHNLHLTSQFNGEFNRAQLPRRDVRFTFNEPEDFVRLKCDVHPWVFAYVTVFDHPYFAVTDRNGVFVLQGIPPGTYTLQARHRKAGVLTREISVEPHRNVDLQLDFQGAPAEPGVLRTNRRL